MAARNVLHRQSSAVDDVPVDVHRYELLMLIFSSYAETSLFLKKYFVKGINQTLPSSTVAVEGGDKFEFYEKPTFGSKQAGGG